MLGIGSVAIGFAFQNILQNFLAGILLLLQEPFQIGDWITITGLEGQVEDIQTRATVIRTADGNRIVIPNAVLFTNPVTVARAASKKVESPSAPSTPQPTGQAA
jgi:small conductance mechanosensitive channel